MHRRAAITSVIFHVPFKKNIIVVNVHDASKRLIYLSPSFNSYNKELDLREQVCKTLKKYHIQYISYLLLGSRFRVHRGYIIFIKTRKVTSVSALLSQIFENEHREVVQRAETDKMCLLLSLSSASARRTN